MPPVSEVNFDNTEIAFRSRSDAALRRAQLLFKSLGSPFLVSTGPRLVTFALRAHLPVTPVIRATLFKQFCGGETIEDCAATLGDLARFGIGSILDYSVEGLGRERDFDQTRDEVLSIIAHAGNDRRIPFAVFKVTGIARFALLEKISAGEKLTPEENAEGARARRRFDALCDAAKASNVRLLVDAEETWIQPAIDQWAEAAMGRLNHEGAIVFNTVQLYRHDRLSYLKELIASAKRKGYVAGVKLVRGAYLEKERARAEERGVKSPIQVDKTATDRDFDAALTAMISSIDCAHLVCGSHNEASTRLLVKLMFERGLEPGDKRVSFSQLLGMSDHLTFNLANNGFNVSKYVPYGPVRAVLPYLFRRAEENTSIKGQVGRELQLIQAEIERRKGLN